jgi:rod shape-determining protein MreB and related proteins
MSARGFEMRDIVYVRIRPHWVSVKNVSRNAFFEDVPQIAVDLARKRNKVLGFGARANLIASTSTETVILNGFDHPRSIISDFEVAEKTMQLFIEKVNAPKKKFFYVPTLVIHPLEKLEGGLTQVEARAFEDLGYRVKASKVYVWNGRALNDEEVISLKFPPEGRCYRPK